MNAIFQLVVVRNDFGIWAFDDESRQLKMEPFVGTVNDLFDADSSGKRRVLAMFSAGKWPNAKCLTLKETDQTGSTYVKNGIEYWFCPAFFLYFDVAPKELHYLILNNLKV